MFANFPCAESTSTRGSIEGGRVLDGSGGEVGAAILGRVQIQI